ncbi:hypothetical protein V6N13_112486 [Hibiscus sabdariffa]|uniref:BZIP domain-containing protein n=1 Tax=Hibiscus sabdariffa TaxID=183260 RepID=A0ABR2TNJ7_9ROSI
MQPREVSGIQYLVPSNPSPYSPHSGTNQSNRPALESNRFSNPVYNLYIPPQLHEISPYSSCISSNSTSDEADEQQLSLIIERKQRRMISNRESARRSRMRKQRHLDELLAQVVWLRNENHQLLDRLNHVSESHESALQENTQLKEEASELRRMISDMRLSHPCSNPMNLEEDDVLEHGLS